MTDERCEVLEDMERKASAVGMRLASPYSDYLRLFRKGLLSAKDVDILTKQALLRQLIYEAEVRKENE